MPRDLPVRSALVLPSPLVGPAAYESFVMALGEVGLDARVAVPAPRPQTGTEVLSAYRAAAQALQPDLVLAHSNAGLVAPAVADGAPVVFVDAALPPASGEGPMAPAAMLSFLEGMADPDGLLPPWTHWWDDADVAALFPDDATRGAVEASQPRLPLAYFRSTVTAPEGWEAGPCAYLAFGGTYADELARARSLGWPTLQLDGAQHLHHLREPALVAGTVADLAAALVAPVAPPPADDDGPRRSV